MDIADVALPADLEAFIAGKVTSGEFVTRNEVFREALTLLRERDMLRAMRLEEFRKLVHLGVDQLDRGESAPWSLEEVKAELQKRIDAGI
jgi:putative addiction module CopG family antidote